MSALLSSVRIPDAPSTHHDNRTSPRAKTGDLCKRYQNCERTIHRWQNDPKLNFPKPTIINGRKYWDWSEIFAWEASRRDVAA
jgi:hypothetical protein